MESDFFTEMASLNKAAFMAFILAKIFGFMGVALGFSEVYRSLGGVFLILAFVSIGISVACSILQSFKDRKSFAEEDLEKTKIKELLNNKNDLELKIKQLQEQHDAMHKLYVNRRV